MKQLVLVLELKNFFLHYKFQLFMLLFMFDTKFC